MDLEQTLQVNIVADDSSAQPVTNRFNQSLRTIKETAGEVADATVKAFDTVAKSFIAVATTVGGVSTALWASRSAWEAVALSAGRATAVLASHRVSVDSLVNVYRAARIAMSPTLFTGISLAAGAAAEKIAELTYRQGALLEQQQRLAAFNSNPITGRSVDALSLAGGSLGVYNTVLANRSSIANTLGVPTQGVAGTNRSNLDYLRDVAAALNQIQDPIARAQTAMKLFGSEGEAVLAQLSQRFVENADRVHDWALRTARMRAETSCSFAPICNRSDLRSAASSRAPAMKLRHRWNG